MIPPFDIFRVDAGGHPLWIQATPSLDAGKSRVEELMNIEPAEYLIVSLKTGNKISIKPNSEVNAPS